MNELVGKKIKKKILVENFLIFFFLWYSLDPGGNGEIICKLLDSLLCFFCNLFPWTSLGKKLGFHQS